MDCINSVDEILEFAIAREVEAHQLYMYLAQHVENLSMRKACEKFAAEELEHKAKLELEVMKTGRVINGNRAMNINISEYVGEVGNPIDMNYKELLVFAVKKEETSVKLYSDLANVMHNQESRDVLLALAQEERKHKLQFEVEYNAVKDK